GSFSNVVIHRLPLGQSVVRPGSRCPACGKPIGARDNVPLLSWLLLLGRSRCCGTKISPRYPLVELLGGLAAWAVLEMCVMPLPLDTTGLRLAGIFTVYFALAMGLIVAAFIDLEHMILPDEITLGGTVLGLVSFSMRGETGLVQALMGG